MDKRDWHLVAWWSVLIVLTLVSVESSWGGAWLMRAGVAGIMVIIVAFIKVRIVILQFMEVKDAPLLLRAPLEIWAVAIAIAVLAVELM